MKKFFIFLLYLTLFIHNTNTHDQQSHHHSHNHHSDYSQCSGWQVEPFCDGYLAQHYHSDLFYQIIYVVGHDVYCLIAGPYGFEYYCLALKLPIRFLEKCKNSCKWLRALKNKQRFIFTKRPQKTEYLLNFVKS